MAPGSPTALLPRALLAAVLALAAAPGAVAAEGEALFRVPCAFSHRAADDPLVHPGRPGAAHLHDFFGNRTTDAFSTYATLRAGATSCRRPGDRAAYWAPVLFAPDGRAVTPLGLEAYYRGDGHADARAVRAFPQWLRMIAGAHHGHGPQPASVAGWHCGPDGALRTRAMPPRCAPGRRLRLQVRFPDCWDGRRLDAPDHAAHMRYARAGRCPASHPVPVPQLVLDVRYPLRDGRGVTLASGPPHTAHADFVNAWDADELRRLVRLCIRGRRGDDRACRRALPAPPPLRAQPRVAAHGELVTLRGEAGAAGGPIRLQYRRAGAWEYLAQATPTAGGSFAFRVRAGVSRSYRALVGAGATPSEVVRVAVRPRVALAVRRHGRGVAVAVRARPMKRSVVVRAERVAGGRRVVVRRELRTRRGRARAALALPAGRWVVRALTRADRRHAAGRSRPVAVRVP